MFMGRLGRRSRARNGKSSGCTSVRQSLTGCGESEFRFDLTNCGGGAYSRGGDETGCRDFRVERAPDGAAGLPDLSMPGSRHPGLLPEIEDVRNVPVRYSGIGEIGAAGGGYVGAYGGSSAGDRTAG